MQLEIESAERMRILRMTNREQNRYHLEFLAEFHDALDRIENDDQSRAVVITSTSEKYFSTGIDIPWAMEQSYETALEFLLSYIELVRRVFVFAKPVVAAINGHAFAGGFFLALAADWRVMRKDRGWLCVPEIDLPFDLPAGHIALMSYVMGSRNTDRISLSGERLSAEQALELTAVDEIATQDELIDRALHMARKLADKDPAQFHAHKLALRGRPAEIIQTEDREFMIALAKKIKGVA